MSAKDNAQLALEEYGRAEYERGFDDGYARALQRALHEFTDWTQHVVAQRTKPPPEVEANGPADAAPPVLPPYLTRALDYLKEHPGVTAWSARQALSNSKRSLYELHKKGLARKDGPKFYPT